MMKPWLKWLIRIPLALLGLAVLILLLAYLSFRLMDRHTGTLISSGEKRSYLLHVPESYDPSTPVPLVISIHGFAEWPAHQMGISHWNDLADEYGFLVVYPSGTDFPKRWRTTRFDPGDPLIDVVFISDLIDALSAEYNIDPDRIYANGLSNGGGMSYVLSCELSERIAAFGSVAGAYTYPLEDCDPSRPVPAILFHGTADPVVPYQGGPSRSFDIPFPVIRDWVEALAEAHGCGRDPAMLPVIGAVSGVRFEGCRDDAEVVFYSIAGGGHTWPGGDPLPEFITGPTNMDIDATRLMWEFFEAHPLRR
jgi:polyhydroxybutyrate depolymerase